MDSKALRGIQEMWRPEMFLSSGSEYTAQEVNVSYYASSQFCWKNSTPPSKKQQFFPHAEN